MLAAAFCCAATNSEKQDATLVLSPPHPELPLTFWELYGGWVILAGVALLALASFAAWWWLRPKPPVVLPPEVEARQKLEALRQSRHAGEDGPTLSRISRVLRQYLIAAFALPRDELVTSEFSRLLAGQEKIGTELATAVGEFLRHCDELKFAPVSGECRVTSDEKTDVRVTRHPSPFTPAATARALELVELGEARRAHLRQIASAANRRLP